jgi:hypothetical protein
LKKEERREFWIWLSREEKKESKLAKMACEQQERANILSIPWCNVVTSFIFGDEGDKAAIEDISQGISTTMDRSDRSNDSDAEDQLRLRVMTFNVWYGGDQINVSDVAKIIISSKADIVGIQEPDANLHKIAALSNMPYVDERRYIISRFPLFGSGIGVREEDGSGAYSISGLDPNAIHSWVLVAPDKMIAFCNTHLSFENYGPENVLEGLTPEDVVLREKHARGDEVDALVAGLQHLVKDNVPLIVTGDFNTPSHRDYTHDTVGLEPQQQFPIEWPITKAMEDGGFLDSYRVLRPCPVAHPGHTYTPGLAAPLPSADDYEGNVPTRVVDLPNRLEGELNDRIDYIWITPAVQVLTCDNVEDMPTETFDSTSPVKPVRHDSTESSGYKWPSDHRAIVATIRCVPIPAKPMIAVEHRRVYIGEDIGVYVCMPTGASWSVVLVPADATVEKAIIGLYNEPLAFRRKIRFGTNVMPHGEYDALLLDPADDNKSELARVRFAVLSREVMPVVRVEPDELSLSGSRELKISWQHTPGHRLDWIAFYPEGVVDMMAYVGKFFTGAKFSGEFTFSLDDNKIFNSPLVAGGYKVCLLRNEEIVVLAQTEFTIVE